MNIDSIQKKKKNRDKQNGKEHRKRLGFDDGCLLLCLLLLLTSCRCVRNMRKATCECCQ